MGNNVIRLRTDVEIKANIKEELEGLLKTEGQGKLTSILIVSKNTDDFAYKTTCLTNEKEAFAEINLVLDILKSQLLSANMQEIEHEIVEK